jgi:hypothetical protein
VKKEWGLDDTQDHANHIQSVWRDLRDDFGGDLLKAHYETGHRRSDGQQAARSADSASFSG